MTDFTTPVALPAGMPPITYAHRLLMLGSCFAGNMGVRFAERKFRVDVNPFGMLYNPFSVAEALRRIMAGTPYTAGELFFYQERWHSFMHHGDFSGTSPEATLANINARLLRAHDNLPQTDRLLITFGTAYVYRLKETGQIVSNCHKLPERTFVRTRLTPDEITGMYTPLIEELRNRFPRLGLLFTVSPIRHIRDGLHENQLSKAVLLMAVDALQQRFAESVSYFPSYEIMMDELRDYRFYADDMVHPSNLAVDYLWGRFGEACFDKDTKRLMGEIEAVHTALAHRPINPGSDSHKCFLEKIVLKMEQLIKKYPYLDFKNEIQQCRTQLKK